MRHPSPVPSEPSGTVAVLAVDFRSAWLHWPDEPHQAKETVRACEMEVKQAIENETGVLFRADESGCLAAFHTPTEALRAAIQAQRSLISGDLPGDVKVRAKMAIHVGMTRQVAGEYQGAVVEIARRLVELCHGGQILLSLLTRDLIDDELPEDVELRDLGRQHIAEGKNSIKVFQALHSDIPSEFPR